MPKSHSNFPGYSWVLLVTDLFSNSCQQTVFYARIPVQYRYIERRTQNRGIFSSFLPCKYLVERVYMLDFTFQLHLQFSNVGWLSSPFVHAGIQRISRISAEIQGKFNENYCRWRQWCFSACARACALSDLQFSTLTEL